VYRARDSKLGRDVAVKVLLPAVAADPERLSRFRREAQILAALNHQNIAHIHGFEDAGPNPALVMELVEGVTLAERLELGAIPLDEALPIARQTAEALEAAHEHGIIHRDLKPANIKVRPDGTVKVLDFGLAKALALADGRQHDGIANSPTITSPAMTMQGVILGTAAYMSPEQAKGKPVDKRADLWAFGCVLFEMLSGRRPCARWPGRRHDRSVDARAIGGLGAARSESLHRGALCRTGTRVQCERSRRGDLTRRQHPRVHRR
jgi:eukaryotic-like serine/threonine-protein kinase